MVLRSPHIAVGESSVWFRCSSTLMGYGVDILPSSSTQFLWGQLLQDSLHLTAFSLTESRVQVPSGSADKSSSSFVVVSKRHCSAGCAIVAGAEMIHEPSSSYSSRPCRTLRSDTGFTVATTAVARVRKDSVSH